MPKLKVLIMVHVMNSGTDKLCLPHDLEIDKHISVTEFDRNSPRLSDRKIFSMLCRT